MMHKTWNVRDETKEALDEIYHALHDDGEKKE
nr:MAG TPA: hypothetical protein [Microviridae sp.]